MNKILTTIPLKRLVLYLLILGLVPFVCIGYFYKKEEAAWNRVGERIFAIHSLSLKSAAKQSLNQAIRKKYTSCDDFYLENQVERLSLLKREQDTLRQLIQNPSFTGNEQAEKRFATLTGDANCLKFTEGSRQSGEGIQETTEILARPVEVDTEDLKELLTRIEGDLPAKPQLLITDLKLNRKRHTDGNEVFELSVKLLKREFTQ